MRTLWRAILVGTTLLSALVAMVDLCELVTTGAVLMSWHRTVRLEVDTVIVSVLATWYLGWGTDR